MTEVFLSEQAARERKHLDREQDARLLDHAAALAKDPTHGEQIRRSRIPKTLRRDYECTNLWRLELPGARRALYTLLTQPDGEPTVSILRILTHKEYDRLFGYHTS